MCTLPKPPAGRALSAIFQRLFWSFSITEDQACLFLNSGDQACLSFLKCILKEWFWNCLCPSVRERSGIHSHNFFPPEASLPVLVGGVDKFSTKAFLPWSDLICPLLMQAPYSSLPVLPGRWGGDAPGVDLMSSQSDLFPYHQGL